MSASLSTRADEKRPKRRAQPALTVTPHKLTRGMLSPFLREHGYPVGDSTIKKLCAPAVGEGPPVCGYWGRRPLHDPAAVLAWAAARVRPVPQGGNAST